MSKLKCPFRIQLVQLSTSLGRFIIQKRHLFRRDEGDLENEGWEGVQLGLGECGFICGFVRLCLPFQRHPVRLDDPLRQIQVLKSSQHVCVCVDIISSKSKRDFWGGVQLFVRVTSYS